MQFSFKSFFSLLLTKITLLAFLFSNPFQVHAENSTEPKEKPAEAQQNSDPNPTPATPKTSSQAEKLKRFKQAARARLISKLTNKNGTPASIYIMPPVDYTTLQNPEAITETIRRAIAVYDEKIDIKLGEYALKALTLEQFRRAMIHLDADVIIVPIMHATNFDIYLYDRRTPYQIYAHSEPIAGAAQHNLSKEAAQYYTKILVRRTLYRYIKNQYYELPRDNNPTVLQSEIPRYIASQTSLESVNREARTNFYASVSLGAALSSGTTNKLWNSNLFSFQFAYRPFERIYFESALEMSAYNIVVGSAKYLFSNKSDSYKLAAGLGLAYTFNRKVLNWDQTNGIKHGTVFVSPSISILFPIIDVYLKAESRLFISPDAKNYIFTIMPGILMMF